MASAQPDAIRVLVVDDEAPARLRLIDLLRMDAQITAILEASDGKAAVAAIERDQPDLVFLDVQMPELDGLGVVQAIGPAHMPLTVFVTAFDQHAVRAFESNAMDYLLKPFSDERLEATLARAKTRLGQIQQSAFAENIVRWAADVSPSHRYLDRLLLKSAGHTQFVPVVDIDWIEGAGVYVNLHAAGKAWLHRASLNDLAGKLDPNRFLRVHRSAIVNIDSILRMHTLSHGEFEVILKHGGRTKVSRSYRAMLEKRLGQSL